MLTASELSGMRAALETLLPGTAVILSGTSTSDDMGGFTTAWGSAAAYACRLDPAGGNELLTGDSIRPYTRYMLTLPHGAAITTDQRVQIGSYTYNVISVTYGDSWKLDTRAVVEIVP